MKTEENSGKHADKGCEGRRAKPVLALLDIGKAPVPSLKLDFKRALGEGFQVEIFGALDDFSDHEILQHPPLNGEDTLFATIPPDEKPILISKKFVTGALQNRVNDIRKVNAQQIILCCTLKFPEFETPYVRNAFDIILGYIKENVPQNSTLGIFIPDDAQFDAQTDFWSSQGYKVAALSMPPDVKDPTLATQATHMRDLNPDTVLYNCMGYTYELFEKTRNIHSIKSMLSIDIVARYVITGVKP